MNYCYLGGVSLQRDQPVPYAVEGEPGDCFDPRLGDDVLAVGEDRVVTDHQLLGNLFAGATLYDQPQDFGLSVGERAVRITIAGMVVFPGD